LVGCTQVERHHGAVETGWGQEDILASTCFPQLIVKPHAQDMHKVLQVAQFLPPTATQARGVQLDFVHQVIFIGRCGLGVNGVKDKCFPSLLGQVF
ncbi:hypothetical protein BV230_15210, partial [Lactiplantibacillus plantarum]